MKSKLHDCDSINQLYIINGIAKVIGLKLLKFKFFSGSIPNSYFSFIHLIIYMQGNNVSYCKQAEHGNDRGFDY